MPMIVIVKSKSYRPDCREQKESSIKQKKGANAANSRFKARLVADKYEKEARQFAETNRTEAKLRADTEKAQFQERQKQLNQSMRFATGARQSRKLEIGFL